MCVCVCVRLMLHKDRALLMLAHCTHTLHTAHVYRIVSFSLAKTENRPKRLFLCIRHSGGGFIKPELHIADYTYSMCVVNINLFIR